MAAPLLRASSARNERMVDLQRIQAFFTNASVFTDASVAAACDGFSAQASVRKLSENKLRPNEGFHGRYAPQGTFTPPRCLKLHGSHLRRHREERPAADRLAAGCAGRGRADRRGACGEFGRDVAGLYRQLPRTGAPDVAAPDAGPLYASLRATR